MKYVSSWSYPDFSSISITVARIGMEHFYFGAWIYR